jgi:hypothetical protein
VVVIGGPRQKCSGASTRLRRTEAHGWSEETNALVGRVFRAVAGRKAGHGATGGEGVHEGLSPAVVVDHAAVDEVAAMGNARLAVATVSTGLGAAL